MIAVALILLALVILFTVAVVVSNPVAVDLSIFGVQIPVQTPAVFFTGACTMLVALVAVWLLRVGIRRNMARRKEMKALKRAAKADSGAGSTLAVDAGSTTPRTATKPGSDTRPSSDTGPSSHTKPSSTPTSTTAADRESLLAEVDEATRDDSPPR